VSESRTSREDDDTRRSDAPTEDECHEHADALERAFGIGESIAVDEACAFLRAAAQWIHGMAGRS
jgi:hypothetical protein